MDYDYDDGMDDPCPIAVPSWLRIRSFVSIDFETLVASRDSACAIGMVKYIDGVEAGTYYSLIKPPSDYSDAPRGSILTRIHGITWQMVAHERTFDELLPEIEAFVDGLPLVAHNANVEQSCIEKALMAYGLTTSLRYEVIIDTLHVSRGIELMNGWDIKGKGTHTLDAVCQRFDVEVLHHHHALDDARMCGQLMLKFGDILGNAGEVKLDAEKVRQTTKRTKSVKVLAEDREQISDDGSVPDTIFKGRVVVLTGFGAALSQIISHQLHNLGAIVKESITKKTQILLTGPNAGPSKIKKCQEQGADIVGEEDLQRILDENKEYLDSCD